MVMLPFLALRRRASSNGSAAWGGGYSPNCKLKDATYTQSAVAVEQKDFHRQQIESLSEAFEIEKVIGTGGFGIVRKATLRSGGPACAVKTIEKSGHVVEVAANSEAYVLKCLSHPNICKLIEVCEDSRHIHLVLEYVNGHELFEEINPQCPMKEDRAACIMKQVFVALQYCHELQPSIIHRDVKPENIMLTDNDVDDNVPHVKIIDWGLATVCCSSIQGPIVGTPCYMSPETISDGVFSRASDVWSAGAVAYMLLTGGDVPHQFKRLSSATSSQARLLQELGTSTQACSLLHGLLKGQPQERLSAGAAARHEWMSASVSPILLDSADEENNVTPSHRLGRTLSASPRKSESLHRSALATVVSLSTECQIIEATDVFGDADFAIFDDFEPASRPVTKKTKQHRTQRSSRIDKELPVASKVRSKVRQPFNATARDCKENLGPGAPRVCKHSSVPQDKSSRTSDTAQEAPERTRMMR